MKAKNNYQLPIKRGEFKRIDRTSSPAHVGKWKNSVDFVCDGGIPIRSSLEGEVVWMKNDSNIGGPDKKYENDGNRIVIKHTNGEYSAYEHLRYKSAEVNVGERIITGQLIGYAGNTGECYPTSDSPDGAHLHFEVFRFTGPNKKEDIETLEVEFQNYKE